MATKPTLLKESLGALRAIQRLNFKTDPEDDVQTHRAFKRADRVLNKAAKLKAA